jgi:hypothetical protein
VRNLIFALSALALVTSSAIAQQEVYLPAEGAVPTADTAIKIARAVLIAWIGETKIQRQEPLIAQLNEHNNWLVTGTLPQGMRGGVGEVEIARRDGRILRMSLGR